jgi:hypothetical protein
MTAKGTMQTLEVEVLLPAGIRILSATVPDISESSAVGKPLDRIRLNGRLLSVSDAVALIGLLTTAIELVKERK